MARSWTSHTSQGIKIGNLLISRYIWKLLAFSIVNILVEVVCSRERILITVITTIPTHEIREVRPYPVELDFAYIQCRLRSSGETMLNEKQDGFCSVFKLLTAELQDDFESFWFIFLLQITIEASILFFRSRILCSDDKSTVDRNWSGSKNSTVMLRNLLDASDKPSTGTLGVGNHHLSSFFPPSFSESSEASFFT
ncbi:hypothetical protein Ahy_B09g094881 isoform A [Arachis hypogaea]|uniref:Uncharacterized protein n=1 Tax=Arachis hypogaea TaxID=3818 RepID=A0A444XD22_ARAHY|nr:hypothetical protein Ahy_B09g094881 isoform A [Arachis hypogaea]